MSYNQDEHIKDSAYEQEKALGDALNFDFGDEDWDFDFSDVEEDTQPNVPPIPVEPKRHAVQEQPVPKPIRAPRPVRVPTEGGASVPRMGRVAPTASPKMAPKKTGVAPTTKQTFPTPPSPVGGYAPPTLTKEAPVNRESAKKQDYEKSIQEKEKRMTLEKEQSLANAKRLREEEEELERVRRKQQKIKEQIARETAEIERRAEEAERRMKEMEDRDRERQEEAERFEREKKLREEDELKRRERMEEHKNILRREQEELERLKREKEEEERNQREQELFQQMREEQARIQQEIQKQRQEIEQMRLEQEEKDKERNLRAERLRLEQEVQIKKERERLAREKIERERIAQQEEAVRLQLLKEKHETEEQLRLIEEEKVRLRREAQAQLVAREIASKRVLEEALELEAQSTPSLDESYKPLPIDKGIAPLDKSVEEPRDTQSNMEKPMASEGTTPIGNYRTFVQEEPELEEVAEPTPSPPVQLPEKEYDKGTASDGIIHPLASYNEVNLPKKSKKMEIDPEARMDFTTEPLNRFYAARENAVNRLADSVLYVELSTLDLQKPKKKKRGLLSFLKR